MDNVPPSVIQIYFELSETYGIVFEKTDAGCILSGLIDNIYNLRSVVDTELLSHRAPQNAATPNPQAISGRYSNMYGKPVTAPPGIPAHVQPIVSRSFSAPEPHVITSSTLNAGSLFNLNSPLQPSMLGKTPLPGSNLSDLEHCKRDTSGTWSPSTLSDPIMRYSVSGNAVPKNHLPLQEQSAVARTPPDASAEEGPRVFSNLNPDALVLVQKLSGAEIPGIEYHIKEGCVRVLLKGECEAEETISKFQDAYKKVASRRIREENVAIPAARSKEEIEEEIAKFDRTYASCAFVMDEEKRHVRVISQARQFEQAKKFLEEALQNVSVATAVKVMNISPNRTLTLKRGDIAREKADVLVNAANGMLLHAGGVARALNAASEGQLQKYSDKYMETVQKQRELPAGGVAVTHGGGNLQCFHVIHAVGPEGTKHSPAECERLVKLAIHNTFKAAERHNVTSIALPALSCGIFGVDNDLVARSIVEAVWNFHYTKPPPVLSDIRIVILDKPTHSCFARQFSPGTKFPKKLSEKKAHDHITSASKPTNDAMPIEGKSILHHVQVRFMK